MSELIEAIKNGDQRALEGCLTAGANVNEQDEQGWTPLLWAAGRGEAEAIKLLLENGADVAQTGRDRRTALMVAQAADRREAVEILEQAEKERALSVAPHERWPYCRAYYIRDMRRFPGWSENPVHAQEPSDHGAGSAEKAPLSDDGIVYLHQDLTVTKSMWHGESVVFNRATAEWREFCERELGFMVPEALVY